MLEQILYELKDKRNFRVLVERAKNRCFPKIPNSHDEINLNDINLKHIELARTKHPDPEVKNNDIILLGTPTTAEAWAKAEFMSGDGTFKITPKLFYQVNYQMKSKEINLQYLFRFLSLWPCMVAIISPACLVCFRTSLVRLMTDSLAWSGHIWTRTISQIISSSSSLCVILRLL